MALVLLHFFAASTASRTVESPWIEPNLCRTTDGRYNRYVTFQPNASTGAPAVGAASTVVGACPAATLEDGGGVVQDIEFSGPEAWPNGGANLSLQVFRAESDCVQLSLVLRDGVGLELFRLEPVQLGEMPEPRNWTDSADVTDEEDDLLADGDDFPASTGRRLLFTSHGQRRLLKGGSSTGGSGSAGSRAVPYRGTSGGVSAWGARAPMRTPYGYSASHVVLMGSMIYLMHRRGYAGSCAGARGCEAVVHESLSRDALLATFTIDFRGATWPLTLTVGANVTRAEPGAPSVYLSFFADQARRPSRPFRRGELASRLARGHSWTADLGGW